MVMIRGIWGALLVVMPGRLLALLGGERSRPVMGAARLLGARHLIEAGVIAHQHPRRTPGWVPVVDLLHALSMAVLALVRPQVRRDALISGLGALGLAGLSLRGR